MRPTFMGCEPLNIPGLEVFAQCCPVCRHFGTTIIERGGTSLLTACPGCGELSIVHERRHRQMDRRESCRLNASERRRVPLHLP